jgi:hypothetical protein
MAATAGWCWEGLSPSFSDGATPQVEGAFDVIARGGMTGH